MYCKIQENEVERIKLATNKNIIIFSPHPDDDVIGMGALLFKLAMKNKVTIFYLTTGFRGVKSKSDIERKKRVRKEEAIKATKILGIESKNLKFFNLPFYHRSKIRAEDVKRVGQEMILNLKSEGSIDYIYVCFDFKDPHRTHRSCFEIINSCLRKYSLDCEVYFYKSIWSSFSREEIDYAFLFNDEIMEQKIQAIKAHVSQLEPAYPGDDVENSFWRRIIEKNKKERSFIKKLNFYKYAELFSQK